MSDGPDCYSMNINLLREPVLRRLCEILDKTNSKGWRKLGEVVSNDRRFRVSSDEMERCSLKVLELEGSPTRSLLRLMGDRGCLLKDLVDFLQAMDHTEALQCIKPADPSPSLGIRIVMQPQSVSAVPGQTVRLDCHAMGNPGMQYQWFKTKDEVPNGISPELEFSPVQVKDTGYYICRVNYGGTFEFSNWAQVEILDATLTSGMMSQSLEGRVKVVLQPQDQRLPEEAVLELECGAVGRPIPQYQWYRNGVPLQHACKRKYTVHVATKEHEGKYRCMVSIKDERTWSREAEVLIDSDDTTRYRTAEKPFATDKVALLIGNLSYQNHPQLRAPMVDVYDLTNLLRQLNFKVVSLLDLTESEMRNAVDEFLLLLHKGVYGLLYYAGHGYENYGNSFMVPVDAPNPYRSANCLCVQSILKLMQEKETGLNVFLLDMCRKRNIHDDTTPNVVLRVTANIVFGYATCQDAEAFELNSSGFTNGVFIKFLKKRLLEDEKITVLLDRVAEDMGQFDPTKGKQALEIRSSLSERRSLTDPILPRGCSDEAQARNLQWAKAHELPESMSLNFDCGVQIKMGFAAEFSNVLVIYTSIVKKPEDISSCQAYVTNFSPELDVDPKEMNRVTPEETGSYLLSKNLPQHCLYTRLSCLQKLREHLVFTVCLQGSFTAVEELVDWTMEVNIGKPLIAKLDLHRPVRRNSCLQTCLMPHSPSHSPCHSPGAEHLQQHCYFPSAHGSTYLEVYEPSHSSHGALYWGHPHCDPPFYSRYHMGDGDEDPPFLESHSRINIPIEATDDIDDLQTSFINSLQIHGQQ
ncbi:mucosa-associated lymphoid tissue lymphoma translocation protein 1 [Paramormyrops kingsleyae]|uniref:MALT1 paracaspase n=1 Tax=Paramormyrops kingsleyae TaxID=1676925 RepID=A0A3B3RY95_9TELE|nr:mucosa-associated lymphoid tissue lymphoma translocation protein 1 [Paramormyrops kingsleyae]XP_023657762.1 mucosa-associated lymphoid tissue lymphoma translocation protein 1 [Paramormyrops kingsleyae]XP_023657769.1 mucosa-associated lymphoid tissue lymphoma translocation protein 1 [Paramormyrops kingsleyae]